jgi:hypothetical protein
VNAPPVRGPFGGGAGRRRKIGRAEERERETREKGAERRRRQLAKANEDKVPFLLPPLISG